MQYIDPLLFSSLLLVTIPTTGFLSWALGIEGIPDKFTIIGGSVMLIGIGLITYSEHQRGKHTLPPSTALDSGMPPDERSSSASSKYSPQSPHSITSLIQLTSPQYSRLQQNDDDGDDENAITIHDDQDQI